MTTFLFNEQDSKPRTIIALWNADFRKPNLHQSDPALIIFDKSTSKLNILELLFWNLVVYNLVFGRHQKMETNC